LYVPGGKAAYPSTVLMTAIPAKVAGVKELALVTPCPGGEINPAVLVAAEVAGVDSVYKVGGAQAVAALAYGTESVPKVDKIVGPGNIYVTIAKKLVFGVVDIDMIAGPSEVLIIADGSSPAAWVAADLLAQAEHDEMAVPLVVTQSVRFAREVAKEVKAQLAKLTRKDIAGEAVKNQGTIFTVKGLDRAVDVANALAPEHLELCVKKPKEILKKIKHAGAIFVGSMSTEAFGDYVAGPSHVLPTGGAARFSSPLSVYDFLRMPSVISISEKGFKALSGSVMNLAYSEDLEAHALSVGVRVKGK
ncbi:MAG: histidinol dehydrogenase, partial [Candidatus Dadabacteria bacterium]|nr:histidinol dehydrogenase [Candidatus Dadabacteria bacterium]